MGNRQTLFQDYAVWNANTITVINKARLEGGKGFEVISLLMTSKHLSILTKFGAMVILTLLPEEKIASAVRKSIIQPDTNGSISAGRCENAVQPVKGL